MCFLCYSVSILSNPFCHSSQQSFLLCGFLFQVINQIGHNSLSYKGCIIQGSSPLPAPPHLQPSPCHAWYLTGVGSMGLHCFCSNWYLQSLQCIFLCFLFGLCLSDLGERIFGLMDAWCTFWRSQCTFPDACQPAC